VLGGSGGKNNTVIVDAQWGSIGGDITAQADLQQALADAAGGNAPPQSSTLTRNGDGSVATVTSGANPTWTITRNPNKSVASMTNGIYLITVNRDGDGITTGTTVTVL
jgi:hypothetical protein